MTPQGLNFDDQVVAVSGAASGIGRATAESLVQLGARVILIDKNEDDGSELEQALNKTHPQSALFRSTDVSDAGACQAAVEDATRLWGPLDGLAHCAGVQSYGTAASTSVEEWQQTLSVDLNSAFFLAKAALPSMQKKKRGSIVMTGSTQSLVAHRNSAAYVTGKHAILGLTRSIALDFAADNIRCNCVLPGAIDTPMIRWGASRDADPQRVLDACSSLALLGRMGTAREVANVIVFLLSDMASFVTGASWVVDGGQLVPCGGTAFQLIGTGASDDARAHSR